VAKLDVQKTFGSSVRAWRTRRGISQEELAGRAGLHRTYVCDIERGARNVSLKSIEKLARALEISLSMLFDYSRGSADQTAQTSAHSIVDILFVEDNADDAELALRALAQANCANRIHVVTDGAAALDFLFCEGEYNARRPGDGPQMILLDLNLPKISGLDVLKRIKSDARTRAIPVVVLTVSRQDRDVESSLRLGAEGYIVKPVDFQSLSEVTPQLSLKWALLKPAAETA
jgi:CheY-like chemotaxis protein/DNA-binding Xre family transcriptional regulator